MAIVCAIDRRVGLLLGDGQTPQGGGATVHPSGKTPEGATIVKNGFGTAPNLSPMTMEGDAATMEGGATPMEGDAAREEPRAPTARKAVSGFRAKASMERRLAVARVAIEMVLDDPGLQGIMADYGYAAARMQEGRALRDRVLALYQQQRAHYGDQYAATDARASAQAQAHAAYIRHVKIARIALRDDRGAAQKLDLSSERKKTQAGWLLQAQQFYANTLADRAIMGKLAIYGATQEQLAAGQRQVAAVEAGSVDQQRQKGLAQQATNARDAAFDALNRWMRDFMAIARIALADQPQALEKLGVVVASS